MVTLSGWRSWVARFPWVPLLLGTGVLVTYLLTLSPGVQGGDPGELQFVSHILGMPHPTGYPSYILLGKLWTTLPFGPSVAWRMNLLSAMSASLAVILTYLSVRLRVQREVPALGAALSLAFGLTFWDQAVGGDKYAFNALMVALVLYLALRWDQTRSLTSLSWLCLGYGFSLTHHRTMLLFAPALLYYVLSAEGLALLRDWRRVVWLAALCLAPLLLYLYLPWAESRNLPPGTWHPQTLGQWIDYFLDRGYLRQTYVDPSALSEALLVYGRTMWQDHTWPALLVGLGGFAWQFRKSRRTVFFLLLSFLLQVLLAANYHVPRHWVFFLPSFAIWALWFGEGLGAVWQGCDALRDSYNRLSQLLKAGVAVAIIALFLVVVPARYAPLREAHLGSGVLDAWRQTLKEGAMAERLGSTISEVEADAIIVCDWEQATPLWYFQQVEGQHPGVDIVYPVERLDDMAVTDRPLYIARLLPGVGERWHPSNVGPLVALRPAPSYDVPSDASSLGIDVGGILELAAFKVDSSPFNPGAVVPLTLYWRALLAPSADYSISVRLLDPMNQQVSKSDTQHPVIGSYPTSRWVAGEVVADYYELQLPADLPPEVYRWAVVVYRSLPDGGWENLQVVATGSEFALGGTIAVEARGGTE